jgi:hypothetical protein
MVGVIRGMVGDKEWDDLEGFELANRGRSRRGRSVEERFGKYGEEVVRMLRGFWKVDVKERWGADEGLRRGQEDWSEGWGEGTLDLR